MVPGIGPSPDKMLLGRLFSYHDTHLHRIGPNALQLPVNSAQRAGQLLQPRRCHALPEPAATRCTRPTPSGDRWRRPTFSASDPSWEVTGEIVRAAYTLHNDDDDFGQAHTMVNKAIDHGGRDRLVSNIVGHVKDGVQEPVLCRVLEYWRKVDKTIGDRIAAGVGA